MRAIHLIIVLLLCIPILGCTQNTVCFTIDANPYATVNGMDVFTKYINVFGVNIFASALVPDEDIKHCAAVMAEYLDNNEEGIADNPLVVKEMVDRNASMILFGTESSSDIVYFGNNYQGNWDMQGLFADEIHPTGSSPSNGFDATLEEVLHLITHLGYSNAYPNIWGERRNTQIAIAMDSARGGYFTRVPAVYPASAWYHYNDQTCDYACMTTEYFYWALTTLLGAQNYTGRCNEIRNEWEICTKAQLQTKDVGIYNLLTDTSYRLATRLPDGNYCPTRLATKLISREGNRIELSPNPVQNDLQIKLDKAYIGSIRVHDIKGQLVHFSSMRGNEKRLDLSAVAPGLYFLRLEGRSPQKFVK